MPVAGDPFGVSQPSKFTGSNSGHSPLGFVAWDSQYIYLNDIDFGTEVFIYSLNGALVKTVKVTDSFVEVPMSRGAYVVKYGNKASKVVL